MAFIYLASPYSHPSEIIRHLRFQAAECVLTHMIRGGFTVYSPIVHCHQMALNYSLPTDATFWENFNSNFLRKASAIWVLDIPGLLDSKGIKRELQIAEQYKVPDRIVKPENYGAEHFAEALRKLA